jgi:hypothetical protein
MEKTLDLQDLYSAFASVGKDRAQAQPYLIGMMSAVLTESQYQAIFETIHTAY